MTSTDTLRAEADAIGRRHPHVRGGCPPHAAQLHRLAALITENDLPDASVTLSGDGRCVTVSATLANQPENVVRRWSQALELIVDVRPYDWEGVASTLYVAIGGRDDINWHVSALVPVPVPA